MAGIHPFGSPELVIEDTLRILLIICYMVIIGMAVQVAVNTKRRRFAPATIWGLLAIIILGMSATGTELLRIGHTIFEGGYWWRLPLNIIGVLVSLMTVQKVRTYPVVPPEERRNPWR